MKYAYEDLSDSQFEQLVVITCQQMFGIAVQGFAPGPDGGRDAKFVGTAELHPSRQSPWLGITIIQAKHTDGFNRSFSEKDFFSSDSTTCIIAEEIPKIRKLKEQKMLDNYIFFSNRRLSAGTETAIRGFISQQCGVPEQSISIFGVEQLELLLKRFPEIVSIAGLDPIDSPLIVSSEELADVVEAFAKFSLTTAVVDDAPVDRVSYAEKNEINVMTPEYAKSLRRRFLKDTTQIKAFLAAPENLEFLEKYGGIVEDFELQIVAKRKEHQTFDEVMEYLHRQLLARDPVLRQTNHKRITRAMLFYMYWNCDIGEVENATAY